MTKTKVEQRADEFVALFYENGYLTCFGEGIYFDFTSDPEYGPFWTVDDSKAKDMRFSDLAKAARCAAELFSPHTSDFPSKEDEDCFLLVDRLIKQDAENGNLHHTKTKPEEKGKEEQSL